MSRYSQSQHSNLTFTIVILVGAAAWTHRSQLINIAYIAISILMCLLLVRICWMIIITNLRARHQTVDNMSGVEFEKYIAILLIRNGFHNVRLTEQYDYGVDIVAEKDGVRWGIQAKRYSGIVGAEAVRQVIAGLRPYNCDRAMVITNSNYSEFAKKLAVGNDCILINRNGLKQLEQSAKNHSTGVIL